MPLKGRIASSRHDGADRNAPQAEQGSTVRQPTESSWWTVGANTNRCHSHAIAPCIVHCRPVDRRQVMTSLADSTTACCALTRHNHTEMEQDKELGHGRAALVLLKGISSGYSSAARQGVPEVYQE